MQDKSIYNPSFFQKLPDIKPRFRIYNRGMESLGFTRNKQ